MGKSTEKFLEQNYLITVISGRYAALENKAEFLRRKLKGSVKEPNKFHIYETEKITRKASDVAEYIELFGSFTRDHHVRHV